MNRELSTQVDNISRLPLNFDNNEDIIFDKDLVNYARSKYLRYVTDEYIRSVRQHRRSIESFYTALHKLDSHDAKSLLYVSNFLENKSWENISFDSDDYRNLLIEYLRNQPRPLLVFNQLIYYKIHNVLPEEYLGWFKNDLRCSLFLAYLIRGSIENEAYKGKDELINTVIDYLRYDIHMFMNQYFQNLPDYEIKHTRVGDHKTVDILYVKSMYLKNRTNDKNLKWIDASNQDQIDWAYNYLSDEKRLYIILEDIFFPETNAEKYELIIASLDTLSNIIGSDVKSLSLLKTRKEDAKIVSKGYSEREDVIIRMEKAWNQLKHDSKNSKSKLVLTITNKNKEKLIELARNANQTPNKFINQAIEDVHKEIFKSDG